MFNIIQEEKDIKAGTCFWCQSCISARLVNTQSPDPRYCQHCFDTLIKEAAILANSRWARPSWVPKTTADTTTATQGFAVGIKEHRTVSQQGDVNLSTLKSKKITVDRLAPAVRVKPGPKSKALPVEEIRQWSEQGIGSKLIARKLAEQGIGVSYKTIQRLQNREGGLL